MEPTTLADDPYLDNFPWPDSWSHEEPLLRQVTCRDCDGCGETPYGDGCQKCRGEGWEFAEDEPCCENGWLPAITANGDEIALACPTCTPQ